MARLAPVIFVATFIALPAAAQAPVDAAYEPVAVQIVDAPGGGGFAAFRAELAIVAKRRVFAELARLVGQSFFWERDFTRNLDRSKSGVENLAAAIGLERGDGEGWVTLARFAAETSAETMLSGTLCAPARPRFDELAFGVLVARTRTNAADWAYPRGTALAVYAAASTDGAPVETLGLHFVRVVGSEAEEKASPTRNLPMQASWVRIVTPKGKRGLVAPGMLVSRYSERLCYARDVTGRWRIAGFIGEGD